jgi:hypothetical protein
MGGQQILSLLAEMAAPAGIEQKHHASGRIPEEWG